MVRILSGGSDPIYLRESAVADVVQNIRRRSVDVTIRFTLNPVWPGADARQWDADVRERVRCHPETVPPLGIVSPGDLRTGLAEQVIHGIAGETLRRFVARGLRAKRRRTVPVGPDQLHRASRTTAINCASAVLGGENAQGVISRGRRRSGAENILMRGITRPLVGLKHPVAPSIGRG